MRKPLFTLLVLSIALTSMCWAEDNVLTPEEKKAGFVLLFNGQDFANFRPSLNYGQWIVEEGAFQTCLFGQAAKYVPPPHLFTAEAYENYRLKVDFKLPPEPRDTHSGIILRVGGTPPNVEAKSLEVNIYGAGRKLGLNSTGSFRHELQAPSRKGGGSWNHLEVIVNENRIAIEMNGETINEIDLRQWDRPGKRPDGSDHRLALALTELPKKDFIGFRTDHGSPIWFKNVKIQVLKKE